MWLYKRILYYLLIDEWKSFWDNNCFFAAILVDLSKAFDTIDHDLSIATLRLYGVDDSALKLFHNCLKNRWQRNKINCLFNSWSELLYGVPEGSLFGPLLFNINIYDLFFEVMQDIYVILLMILPLILADLN